MEAGFGHDFASVRIHTDSVASDSATRVDAAAYTYGCHIVFRSPLYSPSTVAGRRLIAHELTHVVQQRGGGTTSPREPTDPHEAVAADTAAKIAVGGRPSGVLGATAVGIARQPMDPRHARGFAGEQGMGFQRYPAEGGWIFIEGPGGSAGHGVTTSGFDGVAYNPDSGELHLLDNKSLRASTVRSATAIDPEANLPQNIDRLVERVDVAENLPPAVRTKVLNLLWRTRQALAEGRPLPSRVRLVVTGVGGQTRGVSPRLASLGVEYEPSTTGAPRSPRLSEPPVVEPAPVRPTPVEPTPGPRQPARSPRPGGQGGPGTAGGLLGIAFPLVAGWIHGRAVERRIREQAKTEGYVPPGAPSGRGALYDFGAWLIDPGNDADRAVSIEARFNLPAWRAKVRENAARKQPGQTLSVSWNIGLCRTDFFGNQEIETRELTYRKQPDGRWVVESGNASGIPDLNAVISEAVPDQEIKRIVMADPCLA